MAAAAGLAGCFAVDETPFDRTDNTPPEIRDFSADVTVAVLGDTFELRCDAADPDGDSVAVDIGEDCGYGECLLAPVKRIGVSLRVRPEAVGNAQVLCSASDGYDTSTASVSVAIVAGTDDSGGGGKDDGKNALPENGKAIVPFGESILMLGDYASVAIAYNRDDNAWAKSTYAALGLQIGDAVDDGDPAELEVYRGGVVRGSTPTGAVLGRHPSGGPYEDFGYVYIVTKGQRWYVESAANVDWGSHEPRTCTDYWDAASEDAIPVWGRSSSEVWFGTKPVIFFDGAGFGPHGDEVESCSPGLALPWTVMTVQAYSNDELIVSDTASYESWWFPLCQYS